MDRDEAGFKELPDIVHEEHAVFARPSIFPCLIESLIVDLKFSLGGVALVMAGVVVKMLLRYNMASMKTWSNRWDDAP